MTYLKIAAWRLDPCRKDRSVTCLKLEYELLLLLFVHISFWSKRKLKQIHITYDYDSNIIAGFDQHCDRGDVWDGQCPAGPGPHGRGQAHGPLLLPCHRNHMFIYLYIKLEQLGPSVKKDFIDEKCMYEQWIWYNIKLSQFFYFFNTKTHSNKFTRNDRNK